MKIQWNKRYTTISIYTILVIFGSILFYKFIGNWNETTIFLKNTLSTLSPFIIGFLIAYFINPLVVWFEKIIGKIRLRKRKIKSLKTKRGLAILFSYITVLGFIIVILAFIIPELVTSLGDIITKLPDLIDDLIDEITAFVNNSSIDFIDPEAINNFIDNNLKNIPGALNNVYDVFSNIVPSLYVLTKNFTFGILNILLGFIIAIYLLASKEKSIASFNKGIIALFREKTSNSLIAILKDSHQIFSKFFVGKLIDSLIIGILCFIITMIVNIPNALLISVFVGVTNMIPYFGPFIGGFAGIILVLLISPIQALWFALIILALQQFDGNILGPKILGDSTGLSPFWVIFSILVGGKLFGLIGMFLGVPFFAVIKNIIDKQINKKYEMKMNKKQQEVIDDDDIQNEKNEEVE
ncbi:AI-2E family transporter [Vallitalea longa]|uniref:AI-2E family transporter n=1 Tax=Vallitalea longa TaxID=2936439 RepID=A0A9W5YCU3_9FIRM|nr:AI-2E family transporter [Vallitalea longa]GKX30236.1 AI-2E family transporter [Vallitalea longa]